MFTTQFKSILLTLLLLTISACGGGSQTSDSNTSQQNNDVVPEKNNDPAPENTSAVVMVSSNAELNNSQPLNGATKEGYVYIYFQEGQDWQTRGIRRVDFYCCRGNSSSHVRFPSDTTPTYGFELDLSNYSNGTYELYIDVFFEDQFEPEEFHISFNVTNSTPPTPPINNAPSISGSPDTSIQSNTNYVFLPFANDIDGDNLSFSITNRPSWASFETTTGLLTGVPNNTNIGNYTNIIIRVTDGTNTVSLPPFNISVLDQPSTSNTAPVISGNPSTSTVSGNLYTFTPVASDADADNLVFSIDNQPSWATFNTTTGQLSGTPDINQTGTYSNIIISVSDGTDTAILPTFSISVTAPTATGSISLSWQAPTTYTDNSPLTNLAGYRIYYGTSPGNYSNVDTVANPGITTYVVDNLQNNTMYYFVVTAYDGNNVESEFSNSVNFLVP